MVYLEKLAIISAILYTIFNSNTSASNLEEDNDFNKLLKEIINALELQLGDKKLTNKRLFRRNLGLRTNAIATTVANKRYFWQQQWDDATLSPPITEPKHENLTSYEGKYTQSKKTKTMKNAKVNLPEPAQTELEQIMAQIKYKELLIKTNEEFLGYLEKSVDDMEEKMKNLDSQIKTGYRELNNTWDIIVQTYNRTKFPRSAKDHVFSKYCTGSENYENLLKQVDKIENNPILYYMKIPSLDFLENLNPLQNLKRPSREIKKKKTKNKRKHSKIRLLTTELSVEKLSKNEETQANDDGEDDDDDDDEEEEEEEEEHQQQQQQQQQQQTQIQTVAENHSDSNLITATEEMTKLNNKLINKKIINDKKEEDDNNDDDTSVVDQDDDNNNNDEIDDDDSSNMDNTTKSISKLLITSLKKFIPFQHKQTRRYLVNETLNVKYQVANDSEPKFAQIRFLK